MKPIKISISILIFLSILSIANCGDGRGKKTYTTANKTEKVAAVSSSSPLEGEVKNDVREIQMEVDNNGFKPKKFYIQRSEKVKIFIKSTQGDHRIKFDKLDIEVDLPEGKEKVIEFTSPASPTKINFWCTKHKDKKGYVIAKK